VSEDVGDVRSFPADVCESSPFLGGGVLSFGLVGLGGGACGV
jgi:hypothetical protein